MDNKVKKLVLTAIMAGISVLLYLFPKFSLPFFPSFLEMNFSMLPIMICGFACGPMCGGICVLLRYVSNLIIEGSITAGVGEIMDLMLGAVVVISASLIYKLVKMKATKRSLLSLGIGVVVWIFMGAILNVFYAIPLYLKLYFNGNVNILVSALKVIPGVTVDNYMFKYILYAVIPFNMILATVVLVITFFVNKCIYMLYDNEKLSKKDIEELDEDDNKIVEENA